MKGLHRLAKGKKTKFETLYYLTLDDLSQHKLDAEDTEQFRCLNNAQKILEHIAAKAAQEGQASMMNYMAQGSSFDAWNKSLTFDLNNAALLYGELYCFNIARRDISNCSVVKNKLFLEKLLLIKALVLAKEYSHYLLDFMNNNQ